MELSRLQEILEKKRAVEILSANHALDFWEAEFYRLKLRGRVWFDGSVPDDPSELHYIENPDQSGLADVEMLSQMERRPDALTAEQLRIRCTELTRPDWAGVSAV